MGAQGHCCGLAHVARHANAITQVFEATHEILRTKMRLKACKWHAAASARRPGLAHTAAAVVCLWQEVQHAIDIKAGMATWAWRGGLLCAHFTM